MRNRQTGVLAALVFLVFCIYSVNKASVRGHRSRAQLNSDSSSSRDAFEKPSAVSRPEPDPGGSHPVLHLINHAEREFEAVRARQSRTLRDAVAEYRRRYGLPPPPHFDKWWALARRRNVQLVDEFDTIHELITPFWGLKPATTRARAREVLGYDNALLGVQIRGGNVTLMQANPTWMKGNGKYMHESLKAMMQGFVAFLPDMDLAFNINDEPRVAVPHDDLARLVQTARTVNMPAANAAAAPRNSFTEKPSGLNYDGRFDEVRQTRFNVFAHQPVWSHSRVSCPPDSPARILEDDEQFDDISRYALGELGFVYNWTAMSDICLSPSLAATFGFFQRPNAYDVVHDLVPIFSQSKISSYSDITYPSPWYYADKVPYDPSKDPAWSAKLDRLYWRGSTTGGFSRAGGWRHQHRQRVVQKINAPDLAKILTPTLPDPQQEEQQPPPPEEQPQQWTVRHVPRRDHAALTDVYFSHIGQCDPGDCDAQHEFFAVKAYAAQESALGFRHVLDLDGNAFSGRFYALLRSRSLVYKWAVFREWHYEWLRPWVHFVPMSLRGEEWLEAVR
ncbi:glycosyltransferase family 90 protein [Trichocladium antarcticum]|uniref:Glycosyltransferase family 90 protein n=1 Tax=Trichocladium antarcticum TaxID=1450529 RepID=A0AAN6UUW8_9PEZI|nr:glycosyltransferase family 90 protein [Trichocladium antarcticum]